MGYRSIETANDLEAAELIVVEKQFKQLWRAILDQYNDT